MSEHRLYLGKTITTTLADSKNTIGAQVDERLNNENTQA
ncbi:hypothetical protein DSL72_008923 [Monilinia vaccinii-corymbosi]|uniref:Uncharacterized protein n=1 Tax=Monilinia vaccinii-corymbosi TaxID=61207 RepID=A0A8A3PS26_9HELO|nr:hypothetical protein DSL72_008923 [Monilinia vaccinii-corymbosi]